MTIEESTIQNNTALLGGGVFSGQSVQSEFVNSTLIGNKAVDGGGFQCSNCAPSTFSSTLFEENTAISGGGMSLMSAQEVEVTLCEFVRNSAIFDDKWSGYEKSRLLRSVRCNYASGGAICTHVAKDITIQSSNLQENHATNGGQCI